MTAAETFLRYVMANPVNAALLERLRVLDLPDWHLVAGCLFQSVWNGLTGKPPTHGISDYDVFYFDASDLSWEAEDSVIRRCADVCADVGAEVQVRNQARVHLWYPQKHGVPFSPLRSSRDAIDGFLSRVSCFGVRVEPDGRIDVYAPFGFEDVFAMIVRPNLRHPAPAVYNDKAERWRRAWPALTILPWSESGVAPFRTAPG